MREMLRSMAVGSAMGAVAQGIVAVPNDDPEMAQAQAKMRATLPDLRKAVEKPGPGEEGFALKVALPYGIRRSHDACRMSQALVLC
jgi:hypothetical protein